VAGPPSKPAPERCGGPVLNAAYVNKLTPPVNVDGAYLSVGSTISTGGFGGTSWREGFQVDHVLELQMVTGDGQLVTCSDERNSDLFNAALAGMGQCGIIVNVVLALVPAPTHVLLFVLNYTELQTASADLTLLVNDGRFKHLEGRTAARPAGGFTYQLEAGDFYEASNAPGHSQLLAGLRFTSRTDRVITYVEYYRPQNPCNACTPLPHPWLYLCLPASRFVEYAARVLATPAEVAFASPRFSAWRRNSIKRPLARMPNEDLVYKFQLSRQPPASLQI
jgi:cytokinin dehydrogenase